MFLFLGKTTISFCLFLQAIISFASHKLCLFKKLLVLKLIFYFQNY